MAAVTFKAVSHKGNSGLVVESQAHGFKIVMDEPENLGGTNQGMNPVEGLLVSLGSCLVIVGAAFAKAQGIDLQDLWIETEGDLDTDGFLKGKEGVRPGFQDIRFTIHIKSSSPEAKLQEFQQFMESRCPVSDNLRKGTRLKANTLVIER
ncbi:MAG: OsmC family protein [Anaerolineaceae bacterium]